MFQMKVGKQEEGDRLHGEPSTAGAGSLVQALWSSLHSSLPRLTPSPDLPPHKSERDCQYSPGSISLRSVKGPSSGQH